MNTFWNSLKIAFFLPIILIVSWFLTHVMALFGIFATAAYPIWVAFSPKQSFCLGCRYTKIGEKCPLCNEKTNINEMYPKNAKSILLNTSVILLITFISIGVVYLENIVIDFSGILRSQKTVSFVIPDRSQYRVNEIFPMKIEIKGIQTPINVVQADLTFNPEVLEVIDVSTADSFATIFVQKDINNNLGYIRLTGGIPNPGYAKSNGIFGTIYFKTKTAGLVTVSFLPTSLVLANDGRGTNVLKEFPTTSYVIRPERVSVEEEINQREIYEKSVLGATIQDNVNVCRIDLNAGSIPGVLGTTDSNKSDLFGTQPENKNGFAVNIWIKTLEFVHYFNEFVLNLYSRVINSFFTS